MHMPHLQHLHTSMQNVGIHRMRFTVPHPPLTFEGIFLADKLPYQLGLACIAHNFTLLFDVDKQYNITAYIHDQATLDQLKAALFQGKRGTPLRVNQFLAAIDASLPTAARKSDRAQPKDVMRFRRNVEEANKVYLCGWRDNNVYGTNVTAGNLDKTRAWLDEATYFWCKQHNISTRWTDDPAQALNTLDKPNWTQYP